MVVGPIRFGDPSVESAVTDCGWFIWRFADMDVYHGAKVTVLQLSSREEDLRWSKQAFLWCFVVQNSAEGLVALKSKRGVCQSKWHEPSIRSGLSFVSRKIMMGTSAVSATRLDYKPTELLAVLRCHILEHMLSNKSTDQYPSGVVLHNRPRARSQSYPQIITILRITLALEICRPS